MYLYIIGLYRKRQETEKRLEYELTLADQRYKRILNSLHEIDFSNDCKYHSFSLSSFDF